MLHGFRCSREHTIALARLFSVALLRLFHASGICRRANKRAWIACPSTLLWCSSALKGTAQHQARAGNVMDVRQSLAIYRVSFHEGFRETRKPSLVAMLNDLFWSGFRCIAFRGVLCSTEAETRITSSVGL